MIYAPIFFFGASLGFLGVLQSYFFFKTFWGSSMEAIEVRRTSAACACLLSLAIVSLATMAITAYVEAVKQAIKL